MAEPTADKSAKRAPAPPRNDFKSSVLYRNSKALELGNRDPDYVYQNFSTDPESPGYIGNRLKVHERGSPAGGYVQVGPWEVVHSQTDKEVRQLGVREDQGKPVDTVMRYGRQITCRIHKSEFAKYPVAEQAGQEAVEKQIYEPDRISDGATKMTAVVSREEQIDKFDLLRQSGHAIPGG